MKCQVILQACPMKGNLEDSVLDQSSEHFMEHVRQVCSFAKLIPGFKRLAHEDQVTLLKACIFEVLLVRLSGYFDDQVGQYLTLTCWLRFKTFWLYLLE